jgi:biopolymer transport protein ExbD
MLTTSFVEQPGMKLDLPEMQSGISQKSHNLQIQIKADNSIFLNGKQIELNDLETKIREVAQSIPDKSLHIKADKEVSHGTVVKVMDTAKICGLEKIVIISKRK